MSPACFLERNYCLASIYIALVWRCLLVHCTWPSFAYDSSALPSLLLYHSLSIFLYLTLSPSIFLYYSLYIFLYLSLSFSITLSLFFSITLFLPFSIFLYSTLSFSIPLYLFLSLSLSFSITLALSSSLSLSFPITFSLSVFLYHSLVLSFFFSLISISPNPNSISPLPTHFTALDIRIFLQSRAFFCASPPRQISAVNTETQKCSLSAQFFVCPRRFTGTLILFNKL